MLNLSVRIVEAMTNLRNDVRGVVSFEYIIVAACIVATVILVFQGSGAGTVGAALTDGLAKITSAMSKL